MPRAPQPKAPTRPDADAGPDADPGTEPLPLPEAGGVTPVADRRRRNSRSELPAPGRPARRRTTAAARRARTGSRASQAASARRPPGGDAGRDRRPSANVPKPPAAPIEERQRRIDLRRRTDGRTDSDSGSDGSVLGSIIAGLDRRRPPLRDRLRALPALAGDPRRRARSTGRRRSRLGRAVPGAPDLAPRRPTVAPVTARLDAAARAPGAQRPRPPHARRPTASAAAVAATPEADEYPRPMDLGRGNRVRRRARGAGRC